jgi:CBS domain-containing protein
MRTIQEILYSKGTQFNFIDANATVLEALSLMKCENLSYLIVLDKGKYAGIFSENDYARKVILMDRVSGRTPVRDVMSADLPMATATDTAEYCMKLMNMHKTRYMPVFEDFDFKGVITIHDLMREAIANAAMHETISEY